MKLALLVIGSALLCGYSIWVGAGVFFVALAVEG